MLRPLSVAALIASASGFAVPALAQQERVAVSYDAPEECPSGVSFVRNVASRLPRGQNVSLAPSRPPLPEALTLSVHITKSASVYRAELTSFTAEGWSTPRHLEDPSCEELADAMAFTAALTVDPNASADVPSEPASAETPTAPAVSSPPVSPPPRDPSPKDAPVPEAADFSAGTSISSHQPEWQTSVLGGAFLGAVLTPGISPGVSAGVRYSDEALGPWSPAFTLTAFASKSIVVGRSLDANFDMLGGQLELCPSSTGTRIVTFRPCLQGQLFILSAAASNVGNTNDVSVAVPTLGAAMEVQVELSRWLFLSNVIGGQVILQQHRFDVGRPATAVAETRRIAPSLSVRLGLKLD